MPSLLSVGLFAAAAAVAAGKTRLGQHKKIQAEAPTFRAYPTFLQIFPGWAGDEMGAVGDGERSTIAGEGCAMSSLSMGE
jgi:hypothetical protein